MKRILLSVIAVVMISHMAKIVLASGQPHNALAVGVTLKTDVELLHDTMTMEIGSPALITHGESYPSLEASPGSDHAGGLLECEIISEADGSVVVSESRELNGETVAEFPGSPDPGRYRLQVRISGDGAPLFKDTFYFSVGLQELRAHLPEDAHYSEIVFPGEDGRLVYIPDYRGNRIPDFSHAGYMGGGVDLPEAPVRVTLEPEPGDNRARIQAAIDEVSAMEPDEDGIRGAVLLKKGVYEVRSSLNINTSGVVLRGEGPGDDVENLWLEPEMLDPNDGLSLDEFKSHIAGRDATVLIYPATATHGILIARGGNISIDGGSVSEIIDNYVPVGAVSFSVEDAGNFEVGDKIIVRRSGNADWISKIKMDQIPGEAPWSPRDFDFERTITAIDGNRITIHSPIVTAIEKRWGGGRIYRYDESARLARVGMEDMRVMMYSQLQNGLLSHVRGIAAVFEHVRDGWISGVVAEHCYDRVFTITNSTRLTVRDSSVLMAPTHYFAGYVPHYGFFFGANASHVLVRDCYALGNRHAYILCAWVRGPNVVLDSVGHQSRTWSEPHHRWSSGGLYDNVKDYRIAFMNRLHYGSGHGWAGANYVGWNTRGNLVCERPPTAQNWSIGHQGTKMDGPFHGWNMEQFGYSHGYWELHNIATTPIGVEASRYDWGHVPENTLDDDPNTYWMVEGKGEWIKYDLRHPSTINALEIAFPELDEPLEDRVYYFDILVSQDGEDWDTVYTDAEGPTDGPDVFHRYEFPEVEARYVKIITDGSNMGPGGTGPSGIVFHMHSIHIFPEPQWDDWEEGKAQAQPRSLYLQQLNDRMRSPAGLVIMVQ